jgi:hypothetical protein
MNAIETGHGKSRGLPENLYMWGESFWGPWRDRASPLAQQHLDHLVAQFKRGMHRNELRFIVKGSTLIITAGSADLNVDLIMEGTEILDVSARPYQHGVVDTPVSLRTS